MSDLSFGDIQLELPGSEPAPAIATAPESKDALALSSLSEEDRKKVLGFVDKIDIGNTNVVIEYGAGAQAKVAKFSDSVLESVRTKDLGETGKLLSDLVVEIKDFDADFEEKKGIASFFTNINKQIQKMTAKYSKVEVNVNKIADALEGHKRTLLKDVAMFDQMYEHNLAYYKELTLYIIAGQERLRIAQEEEVPRMRAEAEKSGDEAQMQRLNDYVAMLDRFAKKLHDLKLSRMVSLQMAPQIRLIQGNDSLLVERIQSSLVNAIPLWKNQLVIALGLKHAQSALEAQRKVTDLTNEMLQRNSEMLKQGSIDIAKENERGIIDIETIRNTNANLITTIDEVLNIQQEGAAKRASAEEELKLMEGELKSALLEASRRTLR